MISDILKEPIRVKKEQVSESDDDVYMSKDDINIAIKREEE